MPSQTTATRGKKQGNSLFAPTTVNPSGRKCVTIFIPDDVEHFAAFWGHLQKLTRWNTWQWTDDKRGKDLAAVYSEVYADARDRWENGDCGMQVQFRQPDLCTLEASFDGGLNWSLIYDANACVLNGINERIGMLLDDGALAGGQPSPQGEVNQGFCKSWHVSLAAGGSWVAPVPVRANYTIQVTNASGGATDGAFFWRCPDGSEYVLGACNPSFVTNTGDPLPSVYHMRLIMNYDGNFYDAYNLTHTVSPSLVGGHNLSFQVNDGNLGDNYGSYQFDVQICSYGACVPTFEPAAKMNVSVSEGVYTVEVFDTNPDSNNAYQVFADIGDQNNNPCACQKLEIISLTGYTLPSDQNPFNGGAVYPCSGGVIVNERQTGQNWETFYNGLSSADKCIGQFDIKSVTAFTIQFRIVAC